jgi:hypothetical protein
MNQMWLGLLLVASQIQVLQLRVSSETVVRQYDEEYLFFGIISSGEEQQRPRCVVCKL